MLNDIKAPKIQLKIQNTMTTIDAYLLAWKYSINILEPNEKANPMSSAVIKNILLKVVSFSGKAISTEYQYHTNKLGLSQNPKTTHIIALKTFILKKSRIIRIARLTLEDSPINMYSLFISPEFM